MRIIIVGNQVVRLALSDTRHAELYSDCWASKDVDAGLGGYLVFRGQ
jgi:hypothetical protein